MAEKYVQVFCDYRDKFKLLSDKQFGRLIRAAIDYKIDQSLPEFNDTMLLMAWDVIKSQLDGEHESYMRKVMNARASADKRWKNKFISGKSLKSQSVQASKKSQSVQNDEKLSTEKRSKRLQTVRSDTLSLCVQDNIIYSKEKTPPPSTSAGFTRCPKCGGMMICHKPGGVNSCLSCNYEWRVELAAAKPQEGSQ